MPNKLFAFAIEYAKHGWHVFPLHNAINGRCSCGNPSCDNIAKHPRIKNGLLEATTETKKIAQWWKRWPHANIAVRTGGKSGIVVLDIDPRHGGDESLNTLEQEFGNIPDTMESKTGGGGRHIIFNHPGYEIKNRVSNLGDGIDIRADGGYIVVPPSNHANGSIYSWDIMSKRYGISDIPDWLLEKVKANTDDIPEKVEGDIPEGQRHNTLLSFAGSMRRRGMFPDSIYAALQIENQRCHPPLTEEELKKISYSMSKYAPKYIPSNNHYEQNKQQPAEKGGTRLPSSLNQRLVALETFLSSGSPKSK